MNMSLLLYQVLIVLLSLFPSSRAYPELQTIDKDAVLLSQTETLTFSANDLTNRRRKPAVPQLICNGPGCRLYQVKNMRCRNLGASSGGGSEDIEWFCSATVPEGFKLGATDVSCEGYRDRDDPYVLRGSCGITYRLVLTDAGEVKYGTNTKRRESLVQDQNGTPWYTWLIRLCIVYLVISWIHDCFVRESPQPAEEEARREGRWSNSHRSHNWRRRVSDRGRGETPKSSSSSSTKCSTSTGFGSTSRR